MEIYVLGDVRLFADTLNGIAMMFKVAEGERIDLWASNTNGMGLGMGAFLGMLLGLCMLVYNAAFKQRFDYRAIIMPLILYICLTVPKVTVNVVDAYYRDGAQTVSNVPIGLAFPMSAISTVAFSATEKLETVFQVPSNGSFTKITEDGFVMPLKLLHAMRYTGLTMRDAYPNVTETLAEVVKICLTNNDTFDELEYVSSPRSMSVFYKALNDPIAGNRLVKIFPTNKPEGEVVRCSTAGHEIEVALNGYINGFGGSENTLISSEALKVKNFKTDIEKILAANNGNTGSRNLTNISAMRVLDDIQSITAVGNDDALNFVAATAFNPQLSTATECVISTDNRDTARCFSYATANEQWKEKSAAEASGFLSIMRDGQNLLILLSVTLFPIMVLIIVLQGMGGFKVVMSYLLYTISAYMWIPVAAMINYYTQVQLDDELKKWASRIPAGTDVAAAYLSLANAPLFYDAISKKLALANSVMASVPMICMGLFGGMLMTMNRLADKMNPQAGFKASTNTPAVMERGAIAKVGSSVSFDGMNAAGKLNGLPDQGSFSKAKESAAQSQKAQTHLDSASMSAARAYSEAIGKKLMTSDTATLAKQMTDAVGFDSSKTESYQAAQSSMKQGIASLQISDKLYSKQSLTTAQVDELSNTLGIDAAAALKRGEALQLAAKAQAVGLSAISDTIMNGAGRGLDINKVNQTLGSSGNSWQTTSMNSETAKAVATSALIATTAKAAQKSESLTNSDDKTKTINASLSDARSQMESYTTSNKVASEFKMTSAEMANVFNVTDGELGKRVSAVFDQVVGQDAAVAAAYNQNTTEFSNISGAANSEDIRKAHALNAGSDQTRRAFAIALTGGLGTLTGVDINGDHIQSVNKGAYSVHGDANKEVKDIWALKPDVPTKEEIEGKVAATNREVGGQQERIDAAAHTQPTPFAGGVDHEAGVNATAEKTMGAVQQSHVQNNLAHQFPVKLADGSSAQIVIGEGQGGKALTGEALANYYLLENYQTSLKAIQEGNATEEQKQFVKDNAPKNALGAFSPSQVASATTAYVAGAVSGKDNVVSFRVLDPNGNISERSVSLLEAGEAQYNYLKQNKGNPNAHPTGVGLLHGENFNNIEKAQQGQQNHRDNIASIASNLSKGLNPRGEDTPKQ